MDIAYFKADKEVSTRLWSEWKKTQEKVLEQEKNIIEVFDACGLYRSSKVIHGFLLEGHGQQRKGFKCRNTMEGDKPLTICTPDGRCKAGKQFKKLAYGYSSLVGSLPPFSDYIVDKFNVARHIVGRMSHTHANLFYSVAGYVKEQVVLKIPYDDESPCPDIPNFKQIKKSEFIALTEE